MLLMPSEYIYIYIYLAGNAYYIWLMIIEFEQYLLGRWYQTRSNKQWRWTRDNKSGTVIIIQ